MKKQKRRIQRPSYKAAATDLANRLNKAEDDLLAMRRDLSIERERLREATARITSLCEHSEIARRDNDRDFASANEKIQMLALELDCTKTELSKVLANLEASRSVSVVLAVGWRRELSEGGDALEVQTIRDACNEADIEPTGLRAEFELALVDSYGPYIEEELKELR